MKECRYEVIPASSEDFPRLGTIEAEGDAQFPSGRFPGEPGSDNVPVVELEAALAEELLWIAVDGSAEDSKADRAVGFALCVHRGAHLHLRQFAVSPDRQRRGIGSLLLDRVFAEAESRGCSAVTLTTFEDIPWNGPYYRRRGFSAVGEGELTPELRRDVEEETAAGMTGRIAMIRPVIARASTPSPRGRHRPSGA